jgi:hypothetical protein
MIFALPAEPLRGSLLGVRATVCGGMPPEVTATTAPHHALTIDVGEHITVARQQCLGGAHFCTRRQLAFGETVAAVLLDFSLAVILLGTTGAERALVHLAAQAECTRLRELRRANGQA